MVSRLEHHHAGLADSRVHYVSAGAGRPLVLLHGWPQTWYAWRKVMPALAERHFVIAPDWRGLGDSSRPKEGFDKQRVAHDVARLLHDVLGIDSVDVAGHDWGGPVAFALAACHPPPSTCAPTPTPRRRAAPLPATARSTPTCGPTRRTCAEHRLEMPILAIGGAKAYGRGGETLASLQRAGSDVGGGVIEDCGHWIAEEQPGMIATELLRFFDSHPHPSPLPRAGEGVGR